jgi:hypothetical protein
MGNEQARLWRAAPPGSIEEAQASGAEPSRGKARSLKSLIVNKFPVARAG